MAGTGPLPFVYPLADEEIARFLQEDCPYGDLTTHLLGIAGRPGRICFATRHETVVCCSEDAARLLERTGCTVTSLEPSGTVLEAGHTFLEATGPAGALHMGWKASLNLLEAACGIATRTRALVQQARAANAGVEVVATRKVFSGTKAVATKAVYAGGAMPHRLGLSESVLVFDHHVAFLDGGYDELWTGLAEFKARAKEKKIAVEVVDLPAALRAAAAGADMIQVDKMSPAQLGELVTVVREAAPHLLIAAAGGVNLENAGAYAATGVDLLVTSAMYWAKPADIAVRMETTD